MTLLQNIRFGLSRMKRAEADKRVREMVRLTHLEGLEKRYPHQVSGGEAQRAALARALAPAPPILLLDEPLIGLDQELHEEMIELIHNVRQKTETTIVYVTHDLSEAASITDRVIRLRKGAIEQIGGWDEMHKRESPK
jgi:ABC-type sulfate/molybdate transport systems ATPase subunit